MKKALVGAVSLVALGFITSLLVQNDYAIAVVHVHDISVAASSISKNFSSWSIISSLALQMFDDTTTAKENSDTNQRNSAEFTTVSTRADPTKKVLTNFRYYHGFKFPNDYLTEAIVFSDKYIPDFIHKGDYKFMIDGFCGGMAYAALDYWYAHKMIPGYNGDTAPSNDVPLSKYIFNRYYDSLDFPYSGVNKNVLNSIFKSLDGLVLSVLPFVGVDDMEEVPKFIFYSWTKDNKWACKCVLGVCTPCIPGVRDSTNKEIPKVIRSLDQGNPVVLGLIGSRSIGELGMNHIVVAYGYEYFKKDRTYVFYIYEPEFPNTEPVLIWHKDFGYLSERAYRYSMTFDNPPTVKTWRGFFVMDYEPKVPPNMFIDIDYDGIDDSEDNCPTKANSDQIDTNNNGVGNVCESGDIDNDGITDSDDNCKWAANPDQKDEDNDGVGDVCENIIL